MARWYGYTMEQTRGLLMTEFQRFEEFTAQHPPSDLLVAAYLGHAPAKKETTYKEAAEANKGALMLIPKEMGRHSSLEQMPQWVKDSQAQKKKIRDEMKARHGGG